LLGAKADMRFLRASIALSATLALLATPARGADRDAAPRDPSVGRGYPSPPTVAFTVDLWRLMNSFGELTIETRLGRHWALALMAGGGEPLTDEGKHSRSTTAWDIGVEPRWYPSPNRYDARGLYLGWATQFVRALDGPIGFESAQPPPGLSSGAKVGYTMGLFGVLVADWGVGVVVPLWTPPSETSHPLASVVGRFGLGAAF
jgi:hypothetical protein